MNQNQERAVEGERELRDLMASGSPLADPIDETHQHDLRARMLDAFDQKQADGDTAVSVMRTERNASTRRLALVASLAACVVGVAAFGIANRIAVKNAEVAKSVSPAESEGSEFVDTKLVASLADVETFRDEVSANSFFMALAVCLQEHEGRVMLESR